jgi:hypothetical protein
MMNSDLTAVLEDREKTHGSFEDHARITQRFKDVMNDELNQRFGRGQSLLNPKQMEALDMILHKIGRIIAGNPSYEDHWTDIAGYAQIAKDPVSTAMAEAVKEVLGETSKAHVLRNDG